MKPGSGCFGEPTQVIRVPQSLVPAIRGWLDRQAEPPNSLQAPTPHPSALPLPLYATRIAAGFPSPADDHLEDSLDLNEPLIQHPAATVQGRGLASAVERSP